MKKEDSTNTLTAQHYLGYALGDFGCCVTFFTMTNFLTRYYITVPMIDTAILAVMTLLWKVWDALSSPVFGMLMDKHFATHKNSTGKFRPWMLPSAPLMAITAILVFTAPNYVTGASRLIVIFTTYLIYQFFYTMFNIPYGSLLSAMAKTDEERASLSSFRGIGSILGSIVPLVLFPLILSGFEDKLSTGYTVSITVCAAIGFISCFLCYAFTEERTEGTIYGTFNMLRRVGQAIGTFAGVALLGWFGFDALLSQNGLIQSEFTIFGIKALCLLAPALFSLGSSLAFRFLWNITPELKARMSEQLKNEEIS